MKSLHHFLLLFLLPVALVILVAAPVTLWNLHTLRIEFSRGHEAEAAVLELLVESAAINTEILGIHRRISSSLAQATAGKLDEAQMYRRHSEAVDGFAVIGKRIDRFAMAPQVQLAAPDEAKLIVGEFENYRNFMIMASDIAAIDTARADDHIRTAQDVFYDFSLQRNKLGARLAQHATGLMATAETGFGNVLGRTAVIAGVGVMLMIALAFLLSLRVSRKFGVVADALHDLGENIEDTPALSAVERMSFNDEGEFKRMAQALLLFRNALIERRMAEQQLRKLSLAVEQNPNSIVITDLDGRIEYANPRFFAVTGYRLDEVLGQNPRVLHSGKTPQSTFDDLWATLTAGQAWRGEFINKRKNGEEYVEHALISPIRQPDGTVSHYLAIKEDITERKRLEIELEKYRDHLEETVAERTRQIQEASHRLEEVEFALDRSGIAIYWIDAARGRFINVNSQACTLLGYPREELLGMPIGRIDPDWAEKDFAAASAPLREARTGRFETFNRRSDGRLLPVDVIFYYIEAEGATAARFIGFVSDISERRETERVLAAAHAAAEAANRAKSEFLANMSHEIRTPMNAIIGLTQLCLNTGLDARQRDYLVKVDRAASSLLGILNDILDFSKIEAGKLEMEAVDFDLRDVLDNLSALFEVKARQKGLDLHLNAGDDIPAVLRGDPLRLGQVLMNLVGNALKFTEHGSIRVSVERFAGEDEDVRLRFRVRDSGIGMSEAQVAQLFQPFSQADASITRKFGGTGLGLTISQRLVRMMGGEVAVASTPGAGSEFSFTVRLARSRLAALPQRDVGEALAIDLDGTRLLLVEDNDVNQQVARELLERIGASVTVAENGRQALDALAAGQFDGVLMDMQMPVMDGLTATREIRKQAQYQTLPIIAMTANAMVGDRERCLEAGMNDHVGKPINVAELHAVLARHLPHRLRARSETAPPPALPQLAGIDGVGALKSLDNNQALYLDILFKFHGGQQDFCKRMRQLLAIPGEREAAERLAHTLKGLAATIGANALAEAARELEQTIRDGATVEACLVRLEVVEELLTRVLAEIDGIGHLKPASAVVSSGEEDVAQLIREARGLLESFNAEAEGPVVKLNAALAGTVWAARSERVRELVGRYEYEAAADELARLGEDMLRGCDGGA